MSHPSEAELIAFADGELNRDRRRMMDVHLSGCGLCRHALRDLEGAMVGLTVELALIDAAEPSAWRMPASASDQRPASPRSPQGRATTSTHARRRPLSLHATPSSDPRRGERAPAGLPRIQVVTMRWAAALVLVVAGGAAAMVAPRIRGMLGSPPEVAVPATGAPAAGAVTPTASAAAAVSILPERGEATVALTSRPGGGDGRVMVRVSDRRDVQVTVTAALDAGTLPRFTSADGRLEVQLVGRGSVVQVELPSSLRSARVTYEGRTIITVRGTDVSPASARTTGVVLETAREP